MKRGHRHPEQRHRPRCRSWRTTTARPPRRWHRRTDGACSSLAGGRVKGRVIVAVAGGDGEEHARPDQCGGGRVDGRRLATAQGHVGDSAVGAAAGRRVGGNKIDAGDDAGRGAGAARVEDLDSEELRLLGDAVVLAADGAGDVRAVAVTVLEAVVAGKVGEEGGAALKLLGCVSVMVLPLGRRRLTVCWT
jgi:hypothetical protein